MTATAPGVKAPSVDAPRAPLAAWFVLGAGVAGVIGSFLPWVTLSAPFLGTQSASGVDGSDGWITVALGLALVLLGAVIVRGRPASTALGSVIALGALSLLVLGMWKVVDLLEKVRDLRAGLAGASSDDAFGIGRAMSEATQVRVGNGLWLITFAGLIGAVAAVFLLLARRQR
jgi:hypothetical protein